MSEADLAQAIKAANRRNNEKAKTQRAAGILELEKHRYKVEQITSTQFRINGRLDVYPARLQYHDIKTNRRGTYKGQRVEEFVFKFFSLWIGQ